MHQIAAYHGLICVAKKINNNLKATKHNNDSFTRITDLLGDLLIVRLENIDVVAIHQLLYNDTVSLQQILIFLQLDFLNLDSVKERGERERELRERGEQRERREGVTYLLPPVMVYPLECHVSPQNTNYKSMLLDIPPQQVILHVHDH